MQFVPLVNYSFYPWNSPAFNSMVLLWSHLLSLGVFLHDNLTFLFLVRKIVWTHLSRKNESPSCFYFIREHRYHLNTTTFKNILKIRNMAHMSYLEENHIVFLSHITLFFKMCFILNNFITSAVCQSICWKFNTQQSNGIVIKKACYYYLSRSRVC